MNHRGKSPVANRRRRVVASRGGNNSNGVGAPSTPQQPQRRGTMSKPSPNGGGGGGEVLDLSTMLRREKSHDLMDFPTSPPLTHHGNGTGYTSGNTTNSGNNSRSNSNSPTGSHGCAPPASPYRTATPYTKSTLAVEIPIGHNGNGIGNGYRRHNNTKSRLPWILLFMTMIVVVLMMSGGGTGNGSTSKNSSDNAPRQAVMSAELLEQLHRDNQLQHEELEKLRHELEQVQQQQQKQRQQEEALASNSNQQNLRSQRKDTAVAASEAETTSDQQQVQLQKLRGNNNNDDASSNKVPPIPDERMVHLINRSPWAVQVFWISQNVIGKDEEGMDVVEWKMMGGEEHGIQPDTSYHFHARPNHGFAIRKYLPSLEDGGSVVEDVLYTALDAPQDQYVVLAEDFTLHTQEQQYA